jgi:hypothetical protein
MQGGATAKDAVDTQWERLEDQASAEESFAEHTLIQKARRHPVLAQLYPVRSVGRLCFSRCVDYPFYVDFLISSVDPTTERFVVEKTVGQGGWADTVSVQETRSADEAVRVLMRLIPREYGPARLGSAEQWRAEFNKTAEGFRRITPASDEH